MSEPKRYYLDDYGVLIEHPNGEYVLHSDYAAATQWRPIETAPKDGTKILAWYDGQGHLLVHWGYAYGIRGWLDRNGNIEYTPTHWMPFPKPPQEGKQS